MPLGDVHFADDFQPDFGLEWRAVLPRSVLETWDEKRLLDYYNLRRQCEHNAQLNPIGSGWILPSWQLVMANWKKYPNIVILGGNRSSKSVLASRLCVWAAATIPGAEVHAYHVNQERSEGDQQRMVWEALPQAIKALPKTRGQHLNLQYSQQNGFTKHVCILPPHSGAAKGGAIHFGNYKQYQQDAQIAEGYKAHLIWCDEECPQKFWETIQYRTVDYHGRIILTFTTLTGWTPLVADILGKTRTLEKKFAPLVGREVPTVQESLSRPGTVIYYLHTVDNAFIDTTDFVTKIKARPKEEILARAYGIPTKSVQSVFPGFNKEVNVVRHEDIPFVKKPDYAVTHYMSIDPGGSKNWFMLWVAIDAAGTWWVWQEWPDYDDWALPGNTLEGKPGPAQKGSKRSVKDYVDLIRDIEERGGAKIYERYIDPRMGAAETQTKDEGAQTIISNLDDCNLAVIPAPGVEIENGLQLINNLLAWDDTKPRDAVNTPRLFISERCQNLIFAMSEYTAQGGRNESCKDCVDALRYLAVSNIEYYEKTDFVDRTKTFSY